jgi:hypothetical protein
MEDREVGELWREACRTLQEYPDCAKYWWPYKQLALIRKLVAERGLMHQTRRALRDFGIDPATWEGGE